MCHLHTSCMWLLSSSVQPKVKSLSPGTVHEGTFSSHLSHLIMPVTLYSIWQPFHLTFENKSDQETMASLQEQDSENKKILAK